MSRKNFLSSDFFATASEEEAKKAICSLPRHISHITLLKENSVVHSTRFLYEHPVKAVQYYIDVSILPLNVQCVRFNLHCSYANGHAFNSDQDISNALHHFEKAIHAGLNNDFSSLKLSGNMNPAPKKGSYFANTIFSMLFSKYHY